MIDVGDADRPVPRPINQMLTNASGRLPQFSIFGHQSPKTIRPQFIAKRASLPLGRWRCGNALQV